MEPLNGIQELDDSIPFSSTNKKSSSFEFRTASDRRMAELADRSIVIEPTLFAA
jgi:hypothetical protein